MSNQELAAARPQAPDTSPEGGPLSTGVARPASFLAGSRLERFGLPIAWVLVIAVFGVLRPDVFLSAANLSTIFGSQSVLLVLSLGLLLVLTTGDFDLSMVGVMGLSAMLIAVLNGREDWPPLAAIGVALAVGLVAGLTNAVFVVFFGVEPIIVTLGTGTVLQGLILWVSGSATVSGVSPALVEVVFGMKLMGIPLGFYYGLALCFFLWFLFERTAMGRRLLFVGRSRKVSRLSGINVGRVRGGALVASAFIAALAGILFVGTTGGADPSSAASFLMPSFAAAFLGATTIMPGRFNPWGTVIAVYFLVTGITGLTLLGAQSYVQQLFYGGALVFAVALSQFSRRRELRDGALG